MGEHLMIDDEIARHAWREVLERHVRAILRERLEVKHPALANFRLGDAAIERAFVQAYHEGVEGMRRRSPP